MRGGSKYMLNGATALFLSFLGTNVAYAQQEADIPATEESEEDLVIVVGVREALRSAQAIKRDADTVVDSITATDIGAFPDKSVAEALQRVAGITVSAAPRQYLFPRADRLVGRRAVGKSGRYAARHLPSQSLEV